MSQLLHSLPVKKKITKELRSQCRELINNGISPYLKVVLVGQNPASVIYTANKKKYCEKIGAKCDIIGLDEGITEAEFLSTINSINNDNEVHGCIIQLPLPSHLKHLNVGSLITQSKDVDGFHAENLYAVLSNKIGPQNYVSCTPKGILTLLKEYQISLSGKSIAVVGRSLIVGKPLSMLLTNENATVTLCHSHTQNLKEICRNSEIIICAIGIPQFLDETYLSSAKNQIIIDVGICTDANGQICGDVDFAKVNNSVAAITPVPGGVGPMTIVSLAQNLLQASKNRLSL